MDIYMCRWRLELGSTGVPRNNSSWGQIGAVESATCKSALTPGTPELQVVACCHLCQYHELRLVLMILLVTFMAFFKSISTS